MTIPAITPMSDLPVLSSGSMAGNVAFVVRDPNDLSDSADGKAKQVSFDNALYSSLPRDGRTVATLEAYLANNAVFNVKDFGARGDGVTDDAPTIQAAIDAANGIGGGVVFVPHGTYIVGSTLSMVGVNNVRVYGAGAGASVLKASGVLTSLFSSFPAPADLPPTNWTASNIEIAYLTLDMDYDDVPDGGQTNPTYPPHNYGADNYQFPIYMWNWRRVWVHHNEIKNSWFNGIEMYTVQDVYIHDNYIHNCGDKQSYLGHYSGIELDGIWRNVLITNNTISNVGTAINGNNTYGNTDPDGNRISSGLIIAHNSIYTCISGIYLIDACNEVVIQGNTVKESQGSGIEVLMVSSALNGYIGGRRVSVLGNIIWNYNLGGGAGNPGIRMNVEFGDCSHNMVLNGLNGTIGTYGIVVQPLQETVGGVLTTYHGVRCSDNFVRGQFYGSYGILFAVAKGLCSGNYVETTDATAAGGIAVGADDVTLMGNSLVGTYAVAPVVNLGFTFGSLRYAVGFDIWVMSGRLQPDGINLGANTVTMDEGGVRSWTMNAGGGNVSLVSGDNLGNFIAPNFNTPGVYKVAGTQVVGAQAAAIPNATGGATVDTQARTALNALLAAIRTHGLIAP